MARNRPTFGEIARESGDKNEEITRNPKNALTRPEDGVRGAIFPIFALRGAHLFFFSEISTSLPKGAFRRLVR